MSQEKSLVTERESKAFYCMKCFAILCVIAAHINQYSDSSVLENVITRIWSHIAKYGVACFFIVGGFFYRRTEGDGKRFWTKKFRTLVIPWLFCASLTFLVTRRWVTEGSYFEEAKGRILSDYIKWISGYETIYYFVVVFLFCQLIFKFLARKDSYLYLSILATAAALILKEMGYADGMDRFFLKEQLNPLYRVGLFALGILARKYRIDRALLERKRYIWIPALILLITTPYLFKNFQNSSFHPVCALDSAAFCAVLYVVCYRIANTRSARFLAEIGRSTYCIYLLHLEICLIAVDRLPQGFLKTTAMPLIGFCIMAVLVGVGKWVCKYLPFGKNIKALVGL